MKVRNRLALFLSLLLLLGAMVGCSAPIRSMDKSIADMPQEPNGTVLESMEIPQQIPQNRKLIRILELTAETEDLGAFMNKLDDQLAAFEGYVERRSTEHGSPNSARRRCTEMTLRIPAKSVDQFVTQVSQYGNVVASSESCEDVTLSYADTESRITALKTEETRLLALMAQAEDLEDLLMVEERLTEVQSELETVSGQLRVYDNLVDYATLHLRVDEVAVLTQPQETLWQRIKAGFTESFTKLVGGLEDILVLTLAKLPYLIFLGILTGIVLLIVRFSNKKRKKKFTSR